MKFSIHSIKQYFVQPALFLVCLSFSSCSKFVNVDPPSTQITGTVVYTDEATASSVILGIYSRMMNDYPGFANGAITLYCGLSADELQNYSPVAFQAEFYTNSLSPSNSLLSKLWFEAWQYVYAANAVIEGVNASVALSKPAKSSLIAEAKFIRAFCHYYLFNLFGDIPYVTSTDYNVNSSLIRQPVTAVFDNIIADLQEAETSLSTDYSLSNGAKTRPNRFAAKALLARILLFKEDWQACISKCTEIIQNSNCSIANDLNSVFLKNSSEAIWQLQPTSTDINTLEGNRFILTGVPQSATLYKPFLSSFETDDSRKDNWIQNKIVNSDTFYFPWKYKIKTGSILNEYYMVLRLAEIYLIRSEAYAKLSNIPAAQSDLNVIRNRASLPNTSAIDQNSLLAAIGQEMKVEFFAEWGHRWLNLKRTGKADGVLSLIKPGWNSKALLYPIPLTQLQNDPGFTQNSGY